MEVLFALLSGLVLGWVLGADWERSKQLREELRMLLDSQPTWEWEVKEEKEVRD